MSRTQPTPDFRGTCVSGERARTVLLCLKVCDQLLNNDPQSAAEYGYRALAIAESLGDESWIAHSLYRIGICGMHGARYDESLQLLEKSLAVFTELCDELMQARVQYVMGQIYTDRNDYSAALRWYYKSLEQLERLGDTDWIARTLNGIGCLNNAAGRYGAAAEAVVKAVHLWEGEHRSVNIGVSYRHLATIHQAIGDNDEAARYAEKALELARHDRNRPEEAASLVVTGRLLAQSGQAEAAMQAMTDALGIFRETGGRARIAEVLGYIGDLYEQSGRLYNALHCYRQAQKLAEETGNTKIYGYSYYHIGHVYYRQEKHTESLEVLNKAATLLQEEANRLYLGEVCGVMAQVCELLGDTAKALSCRRQHHQIQEEMLGHRKQRTIAAILARHEVEKAAQERERHRLRAEAVETDIQHRERALSATISAITKKSELLKKIHTRLREILNSSGDKAAMLRSLLREVRHSMNLKQDWQEFELLFEEVHRDFIQRLAEQFPALSPTEIRLCALLKTNLSSKEVSRLLSLSERTVATHRYSIRKKLGIAQSASLVTWLNSL